MPCLVSTSSVLMLQTFLAGIRVPKDHRRPPEVWQSFLAKLFLEWVPRKGSGKGALAAGQTSQVGARKSKAAEAAAASAKGIGHGSWQQAWWVGRLRMDLPALEMALQSGRLVNWSPYAPAPQLVLSDSSRAASGGWRSAQSAASLSKVCPSAAAVPLSMALLNGGMLL